MGRDGLSGPPARGADPVFRTPVCLCRCIRCPDIRPAVSSGLAGEGCCPVYREPVRESFRSTDHANLPGTGAIRLHLTVCPILHISCWLKMLDPLLIMN